MTSVEIPGIEARVGTNKEIIEYVRRWQRNSKDKQASHQIVCLTLRLIISIANRHRSRAHTLEDLVQVGIIGLFKSLVTFDCNQGNRFTTYASWAIDRHIQRAIDSEERMIRLPGVALKVGRRLARQRCDGDYDDERLTAEELAVKEGVAVRTIKGVLATSQVDELDMLLVPDEDLRVVDCVADDKAGDPCQQAINSQSAKVVHELLEGLKPTHREVIIRRFGLLGQPRHTLRETGNLVGLGRGATLYAEKAALAKLRKAAIRLNITAHDLF